MWIDAQKKRNPLTRNVDCPKLRWNCNVGKRVWILANCNEIAIFGFRWFSVYSPSHTKCVSIVKTEVKVRFFAFGWLCVDPLALNVVRSLKNGEISIVLVLVQPFSTNCVSIGEIAVLHLLSELFRAKCVSAVGNHAKYKHRYVKVRRVNVSAFLCKSTSVCSGICVCV